MDGGLLQLQAEIKLRAENVNFHSRAFSVRSSCVILTV